MRNDLIFYGLSLGLLNPFPAEAKPQKPNVLFIAVDDLRPELNCYGAVYMHTPNIDKLSARGTLFRNAYCQQAVSAPSRNSLLTGLRPDAIGIYDLGTFFRTTVPDVTTLPQHFKNNGYQTENIGKIYHVGHGNHDDTLSWSVPKWEPNRMLGKLTPVSRNDSTSLESDFPKYQNVLLPYYASQAPENQMTDARTVEVAIRRMKELKDKPFFLAVGIVKPHLPFVAPAKYWNMYNENDIVVPERKEPEGLSKFAMVAFGELKKYSGIAQEGMLNDTQSKAMIHGYRACVSFIDAQIGILLDALKENNLDDNTIIVLWGDHGWKLGEYGNWCKHSNMELDTNAPLIICAPGQKKNNKTSSLVEFVDVYPTLCELANLKKPAHLQGVSLIPIMKDSSVTVKKVAISQYPREKDQMMGYSMRTNEYRYTRWVKFNSPDKEIVERELYDHSTSKVAKENLAVKPEYKKKVAEMDKLMDQELSKHPINKRMNNQNFQ